LGFPVQRCQGYLGRNPLADRDLIGVSGVGRLWRCVGDSDGAGGILAALAACPRLALGAGGFIGCLLLGYYYWRPRARHWPLILAGISDIPLLPAALTSLVCLNLSPNPDAANEIVFWG